MSSTPSQPGADSDKPALIAGRYQIKQKLGKGTFGEVFLADDLKFNPPRSVALKMLHSKFLDEPGVRADIEREASILARFSHANILRVIDFDISENQPYIVTELAENGSLARKIRPDPNKPPVRMPLEEVGWYLEQLTDALDEAHQAGLIHRDLKPLNILLNRRGRPLIADFGLATAVSSSQSSVLVDAQTSGTPPYMAPEQWMGHAGRASDIYALGIITYQLITGELPYQGNPFELMGQHLNAPIPRLSDHAPGLAYPPALDNVIAGVLAKDPKQRTHSALEFYRHYRNAILAFPSASSSFENFTAYQDSNTAPRQTAYQDRTGPATGSGSTPPGSHPSNPPGVSTPPPGAYQLNSTTGNRPVSSNPVEGPFPAFPPTPPRAFTGADDYPLSDQTATALPPGSTHPSQFAHSAQPEPLRAGIPTPGATKPAAKRTSLLVGLGIVCAIIIVGAIFAGILFLNANSTSTTPTLAANSITSPTDAPSTDTTGATASDTPSPDTAAASTSEPTTTEPATTETATTAPVSSGQSVIARQGSLRKVNVTPALAASVIRAAGSSNSSNTTLQVFSSSETPDKVKSELDNGLSGESYAYAVPEPHKSVPSEFYGGYTKEGSPDLVYIIVDVNNLPAVLKNSGMDDSSIQKLVDDTKGQKSVVFSFEGDGLVNAAFEPDATQTPSPNTTAGGTGNGIQSARVDIPAYNGATSYSLPETISNQVLNSLGNTSTKNIRIEAYKVVGQDTEIQKYFTSYLKQSGWTDASSSIPADTAKSYRDAGILTVGPYTKGQDIVLILIGKGQFASELSGVGGNENVYLVVKATS